MAKHKQNSGRQNKLINLVFKLIIAAMVISITGLLISNLFKTIKNLGYFSIKDILIKGNDAIELSYLKGENIFDIDIQKESGYIMQTSPNYKKIRLIRILPNRLFVDFIKRRPLAIVKLYRFFCVDEESVLFDCPQQPGEQDLPVVWGLETKIFGPKSGRKYSTKELSLALSIIQEARINKAFKGYKIRRIDVANVANASIFLKNEALPDALEVKINQDNIKEEFAILSELILQVKLDLKNIKYIDLRFKEPVIKYKDAQ